MDGSNLFTLFSSITVPLSSTYPKSAANDGIDNKNKPAIKNDLFKKYIICHLYLEHYSTLHNKLSLAKSGKTF